MPVADHRKATECMLRIRDVLAQREEEPSREVVMALTCAGVAVQRRVAFGNQVDSIDHGAFFVTTLALLFVLVVMCQGDQPRPSGAGSSDDEQMSDADQESERSRSIATWETSSYESALRAADGDETSSWASTLRHPGLLCQACLHTAANRSHVMGIQELANIGALFFRQSSMMFMTSLFGDAVPRSNETIPNDFLTLENLDFLAQANNNLDENLQSVADCADSEAGQTVCAIKL